MLEGKPRESLVLYDTAIEVSHLVPLIAIQPFHLIQTFYSLNRLLQVSTLTTPLKGLLDVSVDKVIIELNAHKECAFFKLFERA